MGVDLSLTEDQQAIEDAFGTFFANESPPPVARAAEPLGFDRSLWEKVRALEVPADVPLADLVVIAETVGRAIAPVPLVDHLVAARAVGADDLADGAAIGAVSVRPAVDGTWSLVPAGAVADVVVGVDGDQLVAVRSAPPATGPRNHACAPIADRSTGAGE